MTQTSYGSEEFDDRSNLDELTKLEEEKIDDFEDRSNLDELLNLQRALVSAEEQLARRDALLASIVEHTIEPVIAKDLDGKITAWNPAAEKLYGWKAEEIIGKNVTQIIPPEKREEFFYFMSQVESGKSIVDLHTVRMNKDGRRIPVVLTISPVKARNGEIIGASAIARPE